MSVAQRGAGFLPDSRIRPAPKPIPTAVLERYRKLNDLSGTMSDVLDAKGIAGTISASRLKPTIADARIVGRAITVRNVPQRLDPYVALSDSSNLMSEIEGIHQAGPGDVIVIQGIADVSNMGGIMATVAKRQGVAGAVVDGGVRDVGTSRSLKLPIWSKDVSPITGKWRCVTEEINGTVNVMGCMVSAGDLVIADETGVCFVPQARVEEFLPLCEEAHYKEEDWVKRIDGGISIPDLVKKLFQKFPYSNN
jgi:regulator of RNase E activity RraA